MRRLTRRPAAVLALGLTAGALLVSAGGPADAQQQLTQETPRTADSFVDSVGVVTHFRYADTAYAASDELIDKVQQLGVRHVRDGLPLAPTPDLLAAFRSLPQHGIGLNVVLGTANLPKGDPLPPASEAVAALDAAGIRDVVQSIEAPNEWDQRGGTSWVQDLQTFQRDLYAGIRDDPQWNGIPVLGPSVGRYTRINQLRGVGENMDIANLHNYPRGGPPEQDLTGELDAARAVAPGKPLWVTETGYHTALNQMKASPPVPDAAKGDYLPRALLENYVAGVGRTFIYQLVDEQPEPTLENQEQHFGLLRNDLSETPAYTEIQGLLTGLSDPGPAFTPTPLALQVQGDDSVQHLLLQKRDGSYQLVLWRRGLLHQGTRDLTGSAPVTVTLGGARDVQLRATSSSRSLGPATTVEGVLADRPLVLELGAGRASAAGGATTVRFNDVTSPLGGEQQPQATPATPSTETEGGWGLVVGIAVGVVLVLLLALAGLLFRRRVHPRPADRLPDDDDRVSPGGWPPR